MKRKIQFNEEQIQTIESRLESIVTNIERCISELEEEREGDFWRMSQHEPNPDKIEKIVINSMEHLQQAFSNVRDYCFTFKKSDDESARD